jgi:hypothetical protein
MQLPDTLGIPLRSSARSYFSPMYLCNVLESHVKIGVDLGLWRGNSPLLGPL